MPAGSLHSNCIKAGQLFLQERHQMVYNHQSFVAESTLSSNYLASILQACKAKYHITIVYIFLSEPHMCIDRIEERVKKGGHFVAASDVLRRYGRSKQCFWYTYRYLCDAWKVINNDGQFLAIAAGSKRLYVVDEDDMFNAFIGSLPKQ